MVTKHRQFCPQGDIWQGLETVLAVTTWGVGRMVGGRFLASSEWSVMPRNTVQHKGLPHSKALSGPEC